jgi:hypothetical protein
LNKNDPRILFDFEIVVFCSREGWGRLIKTEAADVQVSALKHLRFVQSLRGAEKGPFEYLL